MTFADVLVYGMGIGLTVPDMMEMTIGFILDLLDAKATPITTREDKSKYRKATQKDIERMFGV